ncbi:hypothetical protein SAMN05216337_104529 [Bradyrhizobium brasilense]|uniref:Uncharacterized protein n=1 Tax=Bradyrhizobium brasilense TaxID=1419277 RepID=A0A1G7IH01_9BRAD|nr:hypothetical protein SAMN05216337_104529 [Bradyrhizobium brasilense]
MAVLLGFAGGSALGLSATDAYEQMTLERFCSIVNISWRLIGVGLFFVPRHSFINFLAVEPIFGGEHRDRAPDANVDLQV